MHTALFEELGLSPNEAKIYDALLSYGGSGVSTIALRAKVHRTNTYDLLRRLIEKGLVYEVLGERETTYEAVDPRKLRELLEEKTRKLDLALPAILRTFHHNLSGERAYIFKGHEGAKNYIRLTLKEGKDMYTLGAKGSWYDPHIRPFVQWFMAEAKKKKMRLLKIYDQEAAEKLPEAPPMHSTEFRVLPHAFRTTSVIDVFGDHVVMFTGLDKVGKMPEDVTIFVLVSRELAQSFHTWWRFIWEALPEAKRRKRKTA